MIYLLLFTNGGELSFRFFYSTLSTQFECNIKNLIRQLDKVYLYCRTRRCAQVIVRMRPKFLNLPFHVVFFRTLETHMSRDSCLKQKIDYGTQEPVQDRLW